MTESANERCPTCEMPKDNPNCMIARCQRLDGVEKWYVHDGPCQLCINSFHDSDAPAVPHEFCTTCGNKLGTPGRMGCQNTLHTGPSVRSDDTERKAFEAWAESIKLSASAMWFAWWGWLARAAVTREEVMPNDAQQKLSMPTVPIQSAVTGDAHPSEHAGGLSGALWLCYHALKASEWHFVHHSQMSIADNTMHPCGYCTNPQPKGHDKDCMVGNGLKAMEAVTRTDTEG